MSKLHLESTQLPIL